MLNEALNYRKLGFSVIILEPRGKKPLISWTEFQKRTATENEIREWFQKWPDANLGVVTGAVSGCVIIDLDGPDGIASANRLGLKSSVVSLTGNGRHLWYKYSQPIGNSVRSFPGIDVRGDGGYICAPPSIHKTGVRYRFLTRTDFKQFDMLQPFPMSIISSQQPESTVTKPDGWIANALEGMKDGNIDDTLTSVLGRLRHDGWTANDARSLLQPHADKAGAEDGHLDEKIENIWNRYETAARLSIQPPRHMGEGLVIHSPTNPDSLKQFEQSTMDRLDESTGQRLLTGYAKLDQMLQGGLKSSRLMVIAARTGTGKTNMLLGIARSLCESGKSVLLFSTEMPYEQIWQRYIATLTNPQDFNKHKFYVCDSFAPNIEKVEEAINAIKPDIFMFDHINHVSEEQQELGTFMQGLNFIRRKYDCSGIVTAQLNRSADWIDLKTGEKVTPRMSMIKGSGTIEQASSRVLLLSETRVTPEMTEIVGNLDKNDNGPKGLVHFGLLNKPYKMVEL